MKKLISVLCMLAILTANIQILKAKAESGLSKSDITIQDENIGIPYLKVEDSIVNMVEDTENPDLYALASSLGADTDYLNIPNYKPDDEHPFNNDCYVDYLHNVSVNEAINYPAERFSNIIMGGMCFGISVIEILTHNGVISPSDIQSGVSKLSEIKYNEITDRYITNYQALQAHTEQDIYEHYLVSAYTYEEQVSRLIEMAEKNMQENKYFLITFHTLEWGHALVGIGITNGSWTFNDINYDKCILTLDSNTVDQEGNAKPFHETSCIYINSETKQSYIPGYEIGSETDVIYASIDDDTLLNYKGTINSSKSINTNVSDIVQFSANTSDNTDICYSDNNGEKKEFGEAVFGDSVGDTFFAEADSIHIDMNDEVESIPNFRYNTTKRWIDVELKKVETFGSDVLNASLDFSENYFKFNNLDDEEIKMFWQIRLNDGTFQFEPYYWWTFDSCIQKNLNAEIKENGILLSGEKGIKSYVTISHYTLDENDNFITVQGLLPDNTQRFINSSNNVLITFDETESLTFMIDDNGDDIYDTQIQNGDVNFDGTINASDASEVLSAYASLSMNQIPEVDYKLADYNEDGNVNASDASELLAYYASISSGEIDNF